LARDLNIVRKMRNEFAHNVHGSNFESGKIKDLLTNLTSSSGIVKGHENLIFYPEGARGDFLKIASIVLYHLHCMIENEDSSRIYKSMSDEWIYSWKYQPPEEKVSSDLPQLQTKK
jgi:hypothetical protein